MEECPGGQNLSEKREDGLSNLRVEGYSAGLGACPLPTQLLSMSSPPGSAPGAQVKARLGEESGGTQEVASELSGLKGDEGKVLFTPFCLSWGQGESGAFRGVRSRPKGGKKAGGAILEQFILNDREQPAWEWGQVVGEAVSCKVCLPREGPVNPVQVSVHGLPDREASEMGCRHFDPEPLPLGRIAPPLGLCAVSCSLLGGARQCSHREGAQLKLNPQPPT